MAEKRISTAAGEKLRTMQEVRDERGLTRIRELPIDQIADFPDHPYKVEDNQDMMDLVESIRKNGVLTPVTVRKIPGGKFEMISGHRRKRACEIIGLRTIRGEVLSVDEDAAAIMMCDSNLHRSVILPSEKAFAYKMRLEAMKRRAGRPKKNNGAQVVHRSLIGKSRDILADEVGESREQIRRYIRLTNLIPQLLELVDEGRIPMRTAVDISYFPENLQSYLYEYISKGVRIPSYSQVMQMRSLLQEKKLTKKSMTEILQEKKPKRKNKIVLKSERAMNLIPEDLSAESCEEYIIRALEHYSRHMACRRNKETAVIKRR